MFLKKERIAAEELFMWEKIESEEGKGTLESSTFRMKVPGGWLVRVSQKNAAAEIAVALSFLPDPEYTWEIDG